MEATRKSYPSDCSDEQWEFMLPYLTLMRGDAPQRRHALREIFNALLFLVKTGCHWRFLPHDFPPWQAVYQQARRWVAAGVFEAVAHDLREIARLMAERDQQPTTAALDSRTLQSTPESGGRAGFDGHKKNGSKIHIAVDTLGRLLAITVTAANQQDRAQVAQLAHDIQEATDGRVQLAYVDQGYTGKAAAEQASGEGITLEVVRRPAARRGFVLLPRRWVAERTFGWLGRFRRLARDYERLATTLAGWHWLAFVTLMLNRISFS
jgi:transposase